MRLVARCGVKSTLEVGEARTITSRSVSGQAILEARTIHLADLLAEVEAEYPDIAAAIRREGIRTTLGVPLLHEGRPVGAITSTGPRCAPSARDRSRCSRPSPTRR